MNNPAKVVQGFMKDKFNIHDDIIRSLGYLLKVSGMNDAFENRCNIKHITGKYADKRTLILNKDSKISDEFIVYALRFEKSYNKHRLNDVSAKNNTINVVAESNISSSSFNSCKALLSKPGILLVIKYDTLIII